MAEPFQRGGTWYARVKDAAGRWRNVTLSEARTKAQARELAADLALKSRRQPFRIEHNLMLLAMKYELRWAVHSSRLY